uniref:DNA-directed RNA polymerase subunit alpha n=2 Tax=Spirogyra maxima TaxID=3180 RepID=RPOA_SPIMX|nr:alpha subunit of RNA polymerase [Spirogyra maxima]O98462.1 RecName: Full=DNA-directed RNA polymerase subunit alpha; Short=PEP; AltName: Full=Plastid-encoded RNA polymerase subunit alpha; Short=RNA polymerase subunit alpha [Spirogyra maxima]AAC95318.1 RNA polymerase alpha subunit [Spirogyra maxima]ANI25316.1 alpha subunit of RNA polymerase [Spirogyra maxima]
MGQYTINLRESYPVWKIGSKIDSTKEECLDYMLFIASPLLAGQATTLGVAIRRTLLESIQGTAIVAAKIYGAAHEYSTLEGIQESIHDILLNLKQVIIKNKICEFQKCLISIIGPKKVTAADIELSQNITISNPYHHIATITKPIRFQVELIINKGRGYLIQDGNDVQDGYFPVDALFNPVRNVNFSIHNLAEQQEALILEIWTNGAITPLDALRQGSENLIHLFLPPFGLEDDTYMTSLGSQDYNIHIKNSLKEKFELHSIERIEDSHLIKDQFLEYSKTPIELLELSTRPFKCLKNANIYTINDLLKLSQQDLLKISNMGPSSVKQIVEALDKRFGINLKLK